MKQEELNKRLVNNQETLTFTNDSDEFQLSWSYCRNQFRVYRNGNFQDREYNLQDLYMLVRMRRLELQDVHVAWS
jgi:hypothetical protein